MFYNVLETIVVNARLCIFVFKKPHIRNWLNQTSTLNMLNQMNIWLMHDEHLLGLTIFHGHVSSAWWFFYIFIGYIWSLTSSIKCSVKSLTLNFTSFFHNYIVKFLKSVNFLLDFHLVSDKLALLMGQRTVKDVNMWNGLITDHLVRSSY